MECPLCGAAISERATSCRACGAHEVDGIWTTGSPVVESTGTGRRALAVLGVVAITAAAFGFIAWVVSTMDSIAPGASVTVQRVGRLADGPEGNASAGIAPDETLVFTIDLLAVEP